jgi:hypothetical protein
MLDIYYDELEPCKMHQNCINGYVDSIEKIFDHYKFLTQSLSVHVKSDSTIWKIIIADFDICTPNLCDALSEYFTKTILNM